MGYVRFIPFERADAHSHANAKNMQVPPHKFPLAYTRTQTYMHVALTHSLQEGIKALIYTNWIH